MFAAPTVNFVPEKKIHTQTHVKVKERKKKLVRFRTRSYVCTYTFFAVKTGSSKVYIQLHRYHSFVYELHRSCMYTHSLWAKVCEHEINTCVFLLWDSSRLKKKHKTFLRAKIQRVSEKKTERIVQRWVFFFLHFKCVFFCEEKISEKKKKHVGHGQWWFSEWFK